MQFLHGRNQLLYLMRLDSSKLDFKQPQSWTLISTHMRNVAKKCFSVNVPKVLIFGPLVRTGTLNGFSY